jgi:hypothetical protein
MTTQFDNPQYIIYGVMTDGFHVYDKYTKIEKYYIKMPFNISYFYPTSIISFTIDEIVFINSNSRCYIYNYKTLELLELTEKYIRPSLSLYDVQLYPEQDGYFKTDKTFDRNQVKLLDNIFQDYYADVNNLEKSNFLYLQCDNDLYFENKSRFKYMQFYSSDTRGYRYYVSLSYDVEIKKDDEVIWKDYELIKQLKTPLYLHPQLTCVSVLNIIGTDLENFKQIIYELLTKFSSSITGLISEYLLY